MCPSAVVSIFTGLTNNMEAGGWAGVVGGVSSIYACCTYKCVRVWEGPSGGSKAAGAGYYF